MSTLIHPTAIVDKRAELGSEVEVGPYSIIGPHVKIGDRSRIFAHAVVDGHTSLGPENTVFPFAAVGGAPQDLKYKGEPSTLVIGARNTIRENVTLQRGTASGTMTTVIGDGNLFMVGSHVAHDCVIGNHNVFANNVGLAGHVEIGNRVILGGLIGVHQFVRISDFALISAGSMVGKDVPPFCIAQGDRCSLRGINVIGLRRAGFQASDIAEVRQVYRKIFLGHLEGDRSISWTERLNQIPDELASRPLIKQMLDFMRASKRGVTPGRRRGETGDDESE